MANRIEGKYIASEFLGSLEPDVFEVAPGRYVHVEQHRHAQDYVYKVGERETLCWHAEFGVCLRISRQGLRTSKRREHCPRWSSKRCKKVSPSST